MSTLLRGANWLRLRLTPERRTVVTFLLPLLFFFFSGATGLLYQVVWTRKLVLLFGTTAYAVSTVLSIFFLGLGVGSYWGGRLADRSARPLLLYGLFEVVIGVWAVLFILLIDWSEEVVVSLLRAVAASRSAGIAIRAGLAFAFLIVPVTLMGATLPLLAKFVAQQARRSGFRIGTLYSVNTLGAVAGCALTGFVLLAWMGYTQTTLAGAATNGAIGVMAIGLALGISRARGTPEPSGHDGHDGQGISGAPVRDSGGVETNPWPGRLVIWTYAVSGFCALALEVLWFRLLTLVFLGTTYAFTTMLTSLLSGIAVGSMVASPFVDKRRGPVSLLGVLQILIACACLWTLSAFPGLPSEFQQMRTDAGYHWEGIVRAKFYLSFLVLFVPTFLFGVAFPVVVKAALATQGGLARTIGRLYSANTIGGVLGALAGGYLMIPVFGTQPGIVILGALQLLLGAALIGACPYRGGIMKLISLVACVSLFGWIYRGLPADVSQALNRSYVPEDHQPIHYREGVEGTVVVSEPKEEPTGSDRVLWINAVQATASIEKGVKMNRFQGVLPMLFDRRPRRALFMCFGSGITAGTLGLFEYERIDAVEISRDVLETGPLFAKDNLDVIANPKLRFIVDDGRNFLLTSPQKYDLITFEPMPLALAGVSTFYTKEYYDLCLRHLARGGLVSQWVPLHGLNPEIVRSLLYTFTTVFPHYTLWFINADLFVVGSNEPLVLDYPGARAQIGVPSVQRALADVELGDLVELFNCFFMSEEQVKRYVVGGKLMTDDRPWAEFLAPKIMYERTVADALKELEPHFESPTALLRFPGMPEDASKAALAAVEKRHQARLLDLRGVMTYYGGMFGSEPDRWFRDALALDPNDATARYYLKEITIARATQFVRWREFEDAIDLLQTGLKSLPDQRDLLLKLADVYHEKGDAQDARTSYQRYLELGGTAARAKERVQSNHI
ncbi:MAG: fused MFS/spermidine synthase [Candidatus Hydrogenedentes bacterium]|nr:fused MFS/spermidine synthase [Candidatus Hydrogenedentota bacterium]